MLLIPYLIMATGTNLFKSHSSLFFLFLGGGSFTVQPLQSKSIS